MLVIGFPKRFVTRSTLRGCVFIFRYDIQGHPWCCDINILFSSIDLGCSEYLWLHIPSTTQSRETGRTIPAMGITLNQETTPVIYFTVKFNSYMAKRWQCRLPRKDDYFWYPVSSRSCSTIGIPRPPLRLLITAVRPPTLVPFRVPCRICLSCLPLSPPSPFSLCPPVSLRTFGCRIVVRHVRNPGKSKLVRNMFLAVVSWEKLSGLERLPLVTSHSPEALSVAE